MSDHFDAIIIGTGQSGPSLAARFAKEGLRVAIIERKDFGGTCVNTGCIPTKTLVASAHVAHLARRAKDYGVDTGPVSVDMKRVKARKDAIVAQSRTAIAHWMEGLANATVYRGQARFTAPKTVAVGGQLLTADKILINTGGRAFIPDMPGLDRVPYLTNSSMMAVDYLPEHLLIVGGSYIGLEFAQAYRRFGARVTVVEMSDRLISREDPDVSEAVRGILEAEGIAVRLNAKCIALEPDGSRVAMNIDCTEGAPRIERQPCSAGGRAAAEHGRSRPREHRHCDRREGLYPRRRPVPHEGRGNLGGRRRERARRFHPHLVQRLRDRRGQPARRRSAPHLRPDHLLRACSSTRRWAGPE